MKKTNNRATRNIQFKIHGIFTPAILAIIIIATFHAMAYEASGAQMTQFFEKRTDGFIFANPLFLDLNAKKALIIPEGSVINASDVKGEKLEWKYQAGANKKIDKLYVSLDHRKIFVTFSDQTFDIIDSTTAKSIMTEKNPGTVSNVSAIANGFIFKLNNSFVEFTKNKPVAIKMPDGSECLSASGLSAGNSKQYIGAVSKSGAFILENGTAVSSFTGSFEASISMLYYASNISAGALRMAVYDGEQIKLYESDGKNLNQFGTLNLKSNVTGLFGANLDEGSCAIIAKTGTGYEIFNDKSQAAIFTLPSLAKASLLPAVFQSASNGPIMLYYSSNNQICAFELKSSKKTAVYELEGKSGAGLIDGYCSRKDGAAYFLTSVTNSIFCVRIEGMSFDSDSYFSSSSVFASNAVADTGDTGNSTIKGIDINALKRYYENNRQTVNYALYCAAGLLALLAAARLARKFGRASKKNASLNSASPDAQMERLKEMIESAPENIELILNLISLLKKHEKYEEAGEYYKTLIKLRPYENIYYEEYLELKPPYFPYTAELISLYKKKSKIKDIIPAYEEKLKSGAGSDEKYYICQARILARLYMEDRPYADEKNDKPENYKKAAALLERLLEKEPGEITDLALFAEACVKGDELEKALVSLKKLIDLDKSSGLCDHYCNAFKIYNKLSRHEEAAEIFRMAHEQKNNAGEALTAHALEFFNESIKLGNKNMVLLYSDCLIFAYNRQKNVNAAIPVIDRALALYPKEKSLVKRKAFLMLENGMEEGLLEAFKTLYDSMPGDQRIKYEYCKLLEKNLKYDECLSIVFDALKKKENDDKFMEVFVSVSMKLIKSGNFQRVMELSPVAYKLSQSPLCMKTLAEAYLKSGDLERSYDVYTKYAEVGKDKSETEKRQKYIKTLIDERNIAEMKSNENDEIKLIIDDEPTPVKRSKLDFESKIQLNPLEIKAAEAKLYYDKGEYKKAISIFQEVIRLTEGSKKGLLMQIYLINCFLKEKMPAAAFKVYDSLAPGTAGLSAAEELTFKFKAAGIFMENEELEKAENILSEIAAVDMNFKNVSSIIADLKDKISRAAALKQSANSRVEDDSERTMIASVANEIDYIDKKYKIDGKLGKGGMGIVYKATDSTNGNIVAIKIPIITFKDDRGFMERFEREAAVLEKLKHENILNIFDVVKGELPYIVMELLDGKSLKEILKEKKTIGHLETRDIALQCCAALSYTHGLNIVHRDIKPENIMIVENNKVKIMDFGLAKALDESSVTKAGTILGTFAYISPEQCLGESVDGRADLYSLGVMFYEMLAGEKPFTSGDFVSQHLKVKPAAPTKKNSLIPYPVEAIVLKCLEKKPQDRFANAEELRQAWLKIS